MVTLSYYIVVDILYAIVTLTIKFLKIRYYQIAIHFYRDFMEVNVIRLPG
jgi:hypothetical protein